MNTITIQGKQYIPVNERILEFWNQHPNWSIATEILESPADRIRFKASIVDENGILRATGHSEEKEGSSFINKNSYVENAETSAIGRALGVLGIGIDTSVASFEEVANSIVQKEDLIDRTPKAYDDGREWMSEAMLLKTIERYHNGEADIIDRAISTFKMRREYRERLLALRSQS